MITNRRGVSLLVTILVACLASSIPMVASGNTTTIPGEPNIRGTIIREYSVINAENDLRPGDILTFGHYIQDKDINNDASPITWRVLTVEEGRALLISEMNLARKSFTSDYSEYAWQNSSLRRWLNNEFFNKAFSSEEQKKIQLTKIENAECSFYDIGDIEDTWDRVFVLDAFEAQVYFASDDDRTARNTERAKAFKVASADIVEFDYGAWWLRTIGMENWENEAYVDRDGSIDFIGGDAAYEYYYVRPVIWLNLH